MSVVSFFMMMIKSNVAVPSLTGCYRLCSDRHCVAGHQNEQLTTQSGGCCSVRCVYSFQACIIVRTMYCRVTSALCVLPVDKLHAVR